MAVGKLERPPYVHNWVRYNYPDVEKTAKELVRFDLNRPTITYSAGGRIIYDRIALRLDRETAIKAALTKGHSRSREYVAEFVSAFYDYDELRRFSGLPSFDHFVEPYRIRRDLVIPVKPLIVISEGGFFKPIFVVGWSTLPFSVFQYRLLMTVVEDAVFSLTDFVSSPGEFISFPRSGRERGAQRAPLVWGRGDFDLLSDAELRDQMDIYLSALEKAKATLAAMPARPEEGRSKHAPPNPDQIDLDLGEPSAG